ncbi:MAG: hypothetical protein C0392_04195 [Syntrophus sp. (in: bacteria)]|nr:hypothetical protein [Syntrophus sp. (in: bacteria)]
MNDTLLVIVPILFLLVILVLQIFLLRRKVSVDHGSFQQNFESIEKSYERAERVVRDEITVNREEITNAARQSREELGNTLKGVGDTLTLTIGEMSKSQSKGLVAFGERLDKLAQGTEQKLHEALETIEKAQTRSRAIWALHGLKPQRPRVFYG